MMRFGDFAETSNGVTFSVGFAIFDQLGVRFLDFCNLIGRSQNRV